MILVYNYDKLVIILSAGITYESTVVIIYYINIIEFKLFKEYIKIKNLLCIKLLLHN